MSDKYILISRNRNVETDSDDHVVLGSYGYLTDASNAALSTKLSKREFLIVCDIADIHELTRKHVLLYSQDKFGRTKQVGNYEFSTWLCTWEGFGLIDMENASKPQRMILEAMRYGVSIRLVSAAASACLRRIFDINDHPVSKIGGINCLDKIDAWAAGYDSKFKSPAGRNSRKSYKYLELHFLVNHIKSESTRISNVVRWCEFYDGIKGTEEMCSIILSKIPTWVMLRAVAGNKDIKFTSDL